MILNGDRSLMCTCHVPSMRPCFLSNCPVGCVSVRWFEFVVAADVDDTHDVCFIVACNFVDGTEFLFGKEALPLALPTIVITVR